MIRFRRQNGGVIAVGAEAAAIFERYRQLDSASLEAGGVLLGRFIRSSSDIVIDVATVPGQGDKAKRFSFHRARSRSQALINQAWQESEGTRNYLGEWHTHPEDEPYPSQVDLNNWWRICSSAAYEQEGLLFVIVGRIKTCIWEIERKDGHILQLVADD